MPMTDSDTTGWERDGKAYRKFINSKAFALRKNDIDGEWDAYVCFKVDVYVFSRPTLRECQILAHATARLWAGDTE